MERKLQSLIDDLNQLSDQFRELRDGVQKAIRIADEDPEMALTRSRKVLEYVVRDVFSRRVKEPPGTRPLENLLDRLVKDGHFPVRLDAYANTVRKLGNLGTHNFSDTITADDVYQSLTQLMLILEWYVDEEAPDAGLRLTRPPRREGAIGTKSVAAIQSQPEKQVAIVPKGLRSFDASDSDFFLQLLPGPRDKDGLPESLRFWKQRVEETDELAFTVGVIYGPSGCGKSSLMKAGLLPHLSNRVVSVYVEATAEETEARVLKGLRRRFPALPVDLSLAKTITAIRQCQVLGKNQKVLIVLDQFEQWLHAKRQEQETELAQALRQCDGDHVQCIVMVRDDFWLALSRFLDALGISLVVGENAALVDLFDRVHSRNVLLEFGRAFGRLRDNPRPLTKDQESFLDSAINGMAQDGRVIPIQLALFAEMIKGRAWTTATLNEIGGTEGVGVAFLEETLNSTALRHHQTAARAVLKMLLPEHGTDIKGNLRSRRALLDASGYSDHPADFEALIRILDNDVRLMTPTDPEDADSTSRTVNAGSGQGCYQLTHDYLVPSLRMWLSRKQRETRRGRAELLVADRAALWRDKQEKRYLPSLPEFLRIALLTDRRKWTEPQRKMMKHAAQIHSFRAGIAAAILIASTMCGLALSRQIADNRQAAYAASLVELLVAADTGEVPAIVQEIGRHRQWADPVLRGADAQASKGSKKKLRLDLALLPVDQSKRAELEEELLRVPPSTFVVVLDALRPYRDNVVEPLWTAALDLRAKPEPRFQAACALATLTPDDERWSRINTFVAGHLVTLEASALVAWREALRPAKDRLIEPLAAIFRDTRRKEQARSFATETLAEYAADQPAELFDLLADSEEFQFPVLFEELVEHQEQAIARAADELTQKSPATATEEQKERLARRQANIALAMLRLGHAEAIWPKMSPGPDPRVRTNIIHCLSPLECNPRALIDRLDVETGTVRRALVLALGEFSESQLSVAEQKPLIEKLLGIYQNEADAGLHGAAEWLLRKWGQGERLDTVQNELRCDEQQLQSRKDRDKRQWYINTQNQTFVIVNAGEFLMGSPESEPQRHTDETQHRCRIGRRFAIAAHEVTKGEFREFERQHPEIPMIETGDWIRTDDSPQVGLTWYEAAHFCNWLSEQEGIPKNQWCYVPNQLGKYAAGMSAKDKFWQLTGYRLPTEAEWEFACRAGTVTSRYHGNTEKLLPQYAWYLADGQNRTWPVGSLQPNDLGLFDMLGNAFEWCFDRYGNYPQPTGHVCDDTPQTQAAVDGVRRVLRGGAYRYPAEFARSAYRRTSSPDSRNDEFGLRPVRTYP